MADFYTIQTEEGQNIFDIAIQEYGAPQAVFILLHDNPSELPDLDTVLVAGTTTLSIRNNPSESLQGANAPNIGIDLSLLFDPILMDYFRSRELHVNTGDI